MKFGKFLHRCRLHLWGVLAIALTAPAHDPGLSSTTVVMGSGRIEVTLVFSGVDAAIIARQVTPGEVRAPAVKIAEEIKKLAASAIELRLDGREISFASAEATAEAADNVSLRLSFPRTIGSSITVRSRWIAQLPPGHREYVSLADDHGRIFKEALLSSANDTLTAELAMIATAESPRANSSLDFLAMGVRHIWTGYDHLLFLFGLMIVTRNFKSSLQIITCFTIAHSITLAVATLNLVQISPSIVEPLIAASIVYVGVENLWRKGEPRGRWLLTFVFGLIHGFGFASVLRELGVGANGSSITVPLVSFNLGVELGQVAIAAAVLPLIWKLRTRPVFVHRWVPACSTVVALLGAFWFMQRVWF